MKTKIQVSITRFQKATISGLKKSEFKLVQKENTGSWNYVKIEIKKYSEKTTDENHNKKRYGKMR